MTERWQRVKEIYHEALARDPTSRTAYLREACGTDEALLEEVHDLLDFDSRANANGFLDESALNSSVLAAGQRIGSFEIDSLIGKGGMGQVYLATDMRLGRRVALKFLHSEISQSLEARSRFLREARSAASLNHPNIATIYDAGEIDGRLFLTMEYVEGQPLRSILPDEGFTESGALAYACQLLSALDHAHSRGILHRDIKPENVIVLANGNVKLVDFGIAKLLTAVSEEEGITRTGAFIGTLAYASPEVVSGKPATRQSDLYSLGVLLFETLCGRTPFEGLSGVTLAAAIAKGEQASLRDINPAISEATLDVVKRSIAPDPAERFSTAAEMLQSLGRLQENGSSGRALRNNWKKVAIWVCLLMAVLAVSIIAPRVRSGRFGTATPVFQSRSLAILPFVVTGTGQDKQFFSGGLVETLNAKLSRLTVGRNFQVTPASEVRSRKVTKSEEARAEFGANTVLTGSLLYSGNSVRIVCVLIDTVSNRQLGSRTVEADLTNPISVQDRVLETAIDMLELRLTEKERTAIFGHGTQQPGAYDFYLQGRGYLLNFDKVENLESAIAVFRSALEIDSRYALAYAGLGEAYWRKVEITKNTAWAEPSRGACESAIGIDSNLAASHACLGMVLSGTGQYEKGAEEYRIALEREPTNDLLYLGLANAYDKLKRTAEAENTYRKAIDARPHYWAPYSALGAYYYRLGKNDNALAMFLQVVALAPDSFRGYRNLGAVYFALDREAEAIAAFEKSLSIRPNYEAFSNVGTLYFYNGDYPRSAAAYKQALALNRSDYRVWRNFGASLLWAKDPVGSSEAYSEARRLATDQLRINPRDPNVLLILAESNAALGDKQKAREQMETALRLAADDPEVLFAAATLFEYTLGRRDDALNWLAKAANLGLSWKRIDSQPGLHALRQDERFLRLKQTTTKASTQ